MDESSASSSQRRRDSERTRSLSMVGRYEVIREIGRGGMATVFLARHMDLDRQVALKELSRIHASDEAFAERFLRESRLAGSLTHPNIVTVHDYFEHVGTPYIAMEYVPRGSLRPHVGRLSLAQIAGVFEGILSGLAHAHANGIVHRDLKPENVMATADGRVKITDFGIAKATLQTSTRAFVTATGTAVGTPTYMAPEQAMGRGVGPRTDLYAVGIMAYEMLVGRPPFHDVDAPMAVLFSHVNEEIPPAIEVMPQIDAALSRWVENLLVKDPERRTASADEAWEQLEEIAISQIGPRWRREARLPAPEALAPGAARPLTPAPFRSSQVSTPPAPPAEMTPDYVTFEPRDRPEPAAAETPAATSYEGEGGAPREAAAPSQVEEESSGTAPAAGQAPEAEVDDAVEPTPTPPTEGVVARDAAPDSLVQPASEPDPAPAGMAEDVAHPSPSSARPASRAATRPRKVVTPKSQPDLDVAQAVPEAAVIPRRRTTRMALIALVAVAAAAGLGLAAAPSPSGHSTAATSLRYTASAGPFVIRVPVAWNQQVRHPVTSIRLLSDHLAFSSSLRAGAGEFVIGIVKDVNGATLLPAGFTKTVSSLPAHEVIRLGAADFYRYFNVAARGTSRNENIYALPTTQGVIIAGCAPPTSGVPTFAATCERVLASLHLTGGQVLPLGPNPTYASTVGSALATLTSTTQAELPRLESAKTPSVQSRQASQLARAYSVAASAVNATKPGPAEAMDNRAIASALTQSASAYQALASAARHHDRSAYDQARSKATSATQQLSRAVGALSTLGYHVS